MALFSFTFTVLLDDVQVMAVERAVTQMIAAFTSDGAAGVLRQSGYWASREMLESGQLGFVRIGDIAFGYDAVDTPTLGTLRTERGGLSPLFSRCSGRLHEVSASRAFLQWRAPNWELELEVQVPATTAPMPLHATVKRKHKQKRKRKGVKRARPVGPSRSSGSPIALATAIAKQWRRQEQVKRMRASGLSVVRPNMNKGSPRILLSSAPVVPGGLPGLGKRRR
jgi:hypothetical protein